MYYDNFIPLQTYKQLQLLVMDKQNLPNATAVLVLGILSIVTCCCGWGIGIILGVIALVLANKDRQLYLENPDKYLNYNTLQIGKIIAIIGLVLSAITLLINIYFYAVIGEEGTKEMMENLIEKIKHQQEENE